jgi:CHAT domain-containing protein/cytochrome c-type biogenesis protein CcmH/NrfG
MYLDHASTCDFCRPLLRDAVADLNEETTPSEAKQIADLESARPEWQRRLVQRITGKTAAEPAPGPAWRRWITVPRLVFAASALVAGIVAFQIVARPSASEKANSLLARAYGERRTLKMRMSGMPYAPAGEGMKRDADSSFLDRPGTLLQAEVLISRQLASHPSDPHWLQAKARADLMEGKYQSALESLRRADQLAPKSPEILTDLAIANFQLGHYDVAYETLSQVLALRPDDPVALFNRAFAAEQLHLYHQALDDADRYAQLDPHSQWAEEARTLAASIRALLQEHDQSRQTPLLTPEQIAASADDPALRNQIDQRIEEYLKEAAVFWLPRAFPEKASSADPAARQALFFLANLTREQHRDLWLADLLAGSSAPDFPKAVSALSRSIQANGAGEYNISTEQGRWAERWFRAGGVTAGALRARFEQVYAAHFKSDPCRFGTVAAESEKHPYPWLQTQLGLEQAVCLVREADIGGDELLSSRAMERARQADYTEIYLRALFFTADDKRLTGNLTAASNLLSRGLRRFWSGHFPAMQGYNLYDGLAFTADAAGQRQLTYAIWREAVALIDSNEDLLLRAWAHQTLADSAIASGFPQVAHRHYVEAARLFDLAPKTKASQTAALENEISSAQLEAHLGRFDAAIGRLISIQDQVRPLRNTYILQMFYSGLGELELGRHRTVEARQALRPALAIAEQNLRSIHSESERIRWSKNAAPIYLGLVQTELEQGHSQESLETFEWYLGAPLRERSTNQWNQLPDVSGSSTPQPSRMASRLPLLSQETVIAYGLLPGGLAIWVYDDRGVTAQWIPQPTHDLQELIEWFSDLTSDPHSELRAVRRDAHRLYQALIAPVEERLVPGRTLVIEADGSLARVPFEALLDSEGHYLVERWPVVHSLGQDIEARLRESVPVSADWSALIVGSTAVLPGQEMIPLPNIGAEADTVARGFGRSTVLEGNEATLGAVRRELASAALFHFAGHSLTTSERSGLLLQSGSSGNDGPALLDADTLRRLPLPNLRLAVLSACSTASGNEGSGGFGSVMEALLRAGVPHVVASRWAVDSVETRAFMEDFYGNALSGQSVSDAIRLTSRKMMADPRTAHPYYWSAFAAYGRP